MTIWEGRVVLIDIHKPLYAVDTGGKMYLVTGLFFPLGSSGGKDITVAVGDLDEWKSADEVRLMQLKGDNQ